MIESKEIGLALSGGGIRGAIHVGFLDAFESYRPNVKAVAGTSAGSIVGAFYCAGFTSKEIMALFKGTSLRSFVSWNGFRKGLMEMSGLKKLLEQHIPKDFSELEKPFAVTACALDEEELLVIEEGDLHQAVLASCSIPIIFQTVEINGRACVDGGVLNSLPADVLHGRVDQVIGVHLNNMRYPSSKQDNLLVLAEKVFLMSVRHNVKRNLKYCDYFVSPEIEHTSVLDFDKIERLYHIGVKTGRDFVKNPTLFTKKEFKPQGKL
ncbi:patatin-like phospholipase family protein [Sediminitomix flava]|uniref:NTE family protein n=1 Tax=Sediminitomix flava TaxID=379075 RepID=A0A316A2T2_SEDFL|nr:patatin-like phospholipase family protein [Sediminitomix flava]PWJ44017.1 NTE family protein [Sediminitomix flava]